MMLMHHHRTEVDGHFDGRSQCDRGFVLIGRQRKTRASIGVTGRPYRPGTRHIRRRRPPWLFFMLQKMRWVQNDFDRTARDRPYHLPNASFMDTASSNILKREQSFNLSHCTLSEPNYKSVGESLHEAHRKMVAYATIPGILLMIQEPCQMAIEPQIER